jgi:hypothetical protein
MAEFNNANNEPSCTINVRYSKINWVSDIVNFLLRDCPLCPSFPYPSSFLLSCITATAIQLLRLNENRRSKNRTCSLNSIREVLTQENSLTHVSADKTVKRARSIRKPRRNYWSSDMDNVQCEGVCVRIPLIHTAPLRNNILFLWKKFTFKTICLRTSVLAHMKIPNGNRTE